MKNNIKFFIIFSVIILIFVVISAYNSVIYHSATASAINLSSNSYFYISNIYTNVIGFISLVIVFIYLSKISRKLKMIDDLIYDISNKNEITNNYSDSNHTIDVAYNFILKEYRKTEFINIQANKIKSQLNNNEKIKLIDLNKINSIDDTNSEIYDIVKVAKEIVEKYELNINYIVSTLSKINAGIFDINLEETEINININDELKKLLENLNDINKNSYYYLDSVKNGDNTQLVVSRNIKGGFKNILLNLNEVTSYQNKFIDDIIKSLDKLQNADFSVNNTAGYEGHYLRTISKIHDVSNSYNNLFISINNAIDAQLTTNSYTLELPNQGQYKLLSQNIKKLLDKSNEQTKNTQTKERVVTESVQRTRTNSTKPIDKEKEPVKKRKPVVVDPNAGYSDSLKMEYTKQKMNVSDENIIKLIENNNFGKY